MSHYYLSCPVCQRNLRIKERVRGKVIKCPGCRFSFTARDASAVRPGKTAPVAAPAGAGQPRARRSARKVKPPDDDSSTAGEFDVEMVDDEAPEAVPEVKADDEASSQDGRQDDCQATPSKSPKGQRGPDQPIEFKVKIRHDPHEVLAGEYKAKLTRKGLYLSKKDERELLPVGTPADYLEGARFSATFGGRRVEMQVYHFGFYQQLLARDLARYLDGKKRSLRRDKYPLPWYLYLPTVLPLGIPFVARGGPIPYGVGASLATLCFVIAQKEKWSVATRILVCVGLALAGYGAAIAWFVLYVRAQPEGS